MSGGEEWLVPLAEYLGLPMIILMPIVGILIFIFKWAVPKLMHNSSKLTGQITMDIVASLFGEGTEKSIITGVEELEASKLIKQLPDIVHTQLDTNNAYVMASVEMMVMLSEAIMGERFIKSENGAILQNVAKTGKRLLAQIELEREEKEKKSIAATMKETRRD